MLSKDSYHHMVNSSFNKEFNTESFVVNLEKKSITYADPKFKINP